MRVLNPVAFTAAAVVAFSAVVSPPSCPSASAAETAAPAETAMKPVALTQQQVEGTIAAQKQIHGFEATQPENKSDKPDPKADAKVLEIVKKNGFPDVDSYAAVLATIGQVMAGIDPDTKIYVGSAAVIKKQIADVEADSKMPAKEKKETLDELNSAMKTATMDRPSTGNIDLVIKNFDALAQGMEAD